MIKVSKYRDNFFLQRGTLGVVVVTLYTATRIVCLNYSVFTTTKNILMKVCKLL
jgi:hypothetical protein